MVSGDTARLTSPATPVLHGRDRELARLRRAVEVAGVGAGRVVAVVGPAGIGKTGLLHAGAQLASERGLEVLWGHCWDGDGAPPFWPWVQVLRSLVVSVPQELLRNADPDAARAVARVAPELGHTLGVPHDGDDGLSTFALMDGVSRILHHVARHQRLAVLIDDVHRADPSSLRLLAFIAEQVPTQPILLVAAARSGTEQLAEVTTRAQEVIRLEGLDRDATIRLAEDLAGVHVAPELASELHALTSGNPFEVLQLASAGDLRVTSDLGTSEAILSGRLEQLEAEARRVLEVAAVLGPEVIESVVSDVTDLDPGATRRAFGTLETARLVSPVAGVPGRHAFVHALVREATVRSVGEERRRELHRDVAGALERFHAGASEAHTAEIAHHLLEAAPLVTPAAAVPYLRRAAAHALTRAGYDDAIDHLRRAVDVLEATPGSAGARLEVLLELGSAQMRGPSSADAVATFDTAAALAEDLDEPESLARAIIGRGQAQIRAPGFDMVVAEVAPQLEAAFTALEEAGIQDLSLRARVLANVALTRALTGSSDQVLPVAEEARAVADASGDPLAVSLAAVAHRWALLGPEPLQERRAATARVVELAEASGDLEQRWLAQRWRLMDALEGGDAEVAADAIDRSAELAAQLREPYSETLTLVWRGTMALLQGRYADLDAITAEALEAMARSQVGAEAIGGQQLWRSRDLGELDISTVDGLVALFPTHFIFRCLRAWGYAHRGDLDLARDALTEVQAAGIDRLPRSGYWPTALGMLAETAAILQDRAAAAELRPLLRTIPDQCAVAGGGPIVWGGPVAHYLGLCNYVLGEHDRAIELFASAVEVNRRMHARPMLARTQLAWAATLATRAAPGDRARAAELLAAVESLVDEIGMEGLRPRISTVAALLDAATRERPAPREVSAELRRDGQLWRARFHGEPFHVRDSKGVTYLHELLRAPGREWHVLQLVAAVEGTEVSERAPDGIVPRRSSDAGPILDEQAIAAYRERHEALQEELDEAQRFHDEGRAAKARTELDLLESELTSAVGLSGRRRVAGSDEERARVNVTRAIRTAIERLREHDPDLGAHLDSAVRTGRFCQYAPDPSVAVAWSLD